MKAIHKEQEPEWLNAYREKHPSHSWEELPQKKRKQCRQHCMEQQGNICCYCECHLVRPEIQGFCRVEHFHQKSDTSTEKNWHLDWGNMLAACNGQSNACEGKTKEEVLVLYPHPSNLSCDSHKNYLIQKGMLSIQSEGALLHPCQLPAFPSLFRVEPGTGKLYPNEKGCASVTFEANQYATTEELVQKTIDILNLNCDRLCAERQQLLKYLEGKITKARQEGKSPQDVFSLLVQQYFKDTHWPEYFTTIRWRLGQAAEEYLRSISFKG